MSEQSHALRDSILGALIGGVGASAIIAITSASWPAFAAALWKGVTGAGPWGWSVVVLSILLAAFSAKWFATIIVGPQRSISPQTPTQPPQQFPPAAPAYTVRITHPVEMEMITPGWLPIQGEHTGSREHYWLLNNRGNEYWPHVPLDLLPGGTWRQEIYLSPEVKPRNVTVILAWVSPEMNGILESWKSKCKITDNWNGIKMTPPAEHFTAMVVRTLQVPPTPEEMKVRLLSSHVEHVLVKGRTYEIEYEIEASGPLTDDFWLGSSVKDTAGQFFNNQHEDQKITLVKGKQTCRRKLTIPMNTTVGDQTISTNIWRGKVGDPKNSKLIVDVPPKRIRIVD